MSVQILTRKLTDTVTVADILQFHKAYYWMLTCQACNIAASDTGWL